MILYEQISPSTESRYLLLKNDDFFFACDRHRFHWSPAFAGGRRVGLLEYSTGHEAAWTRCLLHRGFRMLALQRR